MAENENRYRTDETSIDSNTNQSPPTTATTSTDMTWFINYDEDSYDLDIGSEITLESVYTAIRNRIPELGDESFQLKWTDPKFQKVFSTIIILF